ncbi:DUF3813 family protein [Bacillus kwashiorkori]|uniref:DUF3813 family protein n=1 Tax=Bacillus kwashiorkori TaxID=1522318 RepID=UPI000D087CB4|nr:DUF3813 family protein [Bacillus kwashiorkori]
MENKQREVEKQVTTEDIEQVKNAISAAFPNATLAEQNFVQQYEEELNDLGIDTDIQSN